MADEWRVAHHIGAFGGRQQLVPVVSQGVGLHDVARIMQRQMRQRLSRDGLRVVQRLLFRDPQRGTRHGHREIVDLDAMHLVDPHLDQAVLAAQFHVALAVQQVGDDAVLQFAQPQIRFGQEVARTARRIEEVQRGEPVLERFEPVLAGPLAKRLVVFDTVELGREIVEEERVDDLVDVPDGGVVHASLAALVVAEGLLHQRAEDDGADGAPVEPVAGREQGFAYQVGELWNQ